tara:strand:+ start:3141 stop:4055 length:915 start_codon:yes stop_codon:yes gene_type:complete
MIRILLIFILIWQPIYAAYHTMISDLGISAQSIALGNTHSFNSSSETIFSNPAALVFSHGHSFSIFSTNLNDGGVNYLQLSLSSNTDFGTIGAGVYHQKVADIPKTAEYFNSIINQDKIYTVGYYGYKNSIYTLAYQTSLLQNVSVGLNFNYYNVSVDTYRGTGNNIDLGILFPVKHSLISIYTQNIIPNRSVNYSHNKSDLLPFIGSISSYIPIYKVIFIPQITYQKSLILMSSGLSYSPAFLPYIKLLGGYKEQLDYTSNKHRKFTFGFGFTFFALDIFYAYERSDYYLKDHHTYISLNYQL